MARSGLLCRPRQCWGPRGPGGPRRGAESGACVPRLQRAVWGELSWIVNSSPTRQLPLPGVTPGMPAACAIAVVGGPQDTSLPLPPVPGTRIPTGPWRGGVPGLGQPCDLSVQEPPASLGLGSPACSVVGWKETGALERGCRWSGGGVRVSPTPLQCSVAPFWGTQATRRLAGLPVPGARMREWRSRAARTGCVEENTD